MGKILTVCGSWYLTHSAEMRHAMSELYSVREQLNILLYFQFQFLSCDEE